MKREAQQFAVPQVARAGNLVEAFRRLVGCLDAEMAVAALLSLRQSRWFRRLPARESFRARALGNRPFVNALLQLRLCRYGRWLSQNRKGVDTAAHAAPAALAV